MPVRACVTKLKEKEGDRARVGPWGRKVIDHERPDADGNFTHKCSARPCR